MTKAIVYFLKGILMVTRVVDHEQNIKDKSVHIPLLFNPWEKVTLSKIFLKSLALSAVMSHFGEKGNARAARMM